MWYVKTSVHRTLHSSKDACSGRGPSKSYVQIAAEGTRLAVNRLHLIHVSIHILTASVDTIQVQLLQQLHKKQNIHA